MYKISLSENRIFVNQNIDDEQQHMSMVISMNVQEDNIDQIKYTYKNKTKIIKRKTFNNIIRSSTVYNNIDDEYTISLRETLNLYLLTGKDIQKFPVSYINNFEDDVNFMSLIFSLSFYAVLYNIYIDDKDEDIFKQEKIESLYCNMISNFKNEDMLFLSIVRHTYTLKKFFIKTNDILFDYSPAIHRLLFLLYDQNKKYDKLKERIENMENSAFMTGQVFGTCQTDVSTNIDSPDHKQIDQNI